MTASLTLFRSRASRRNPRRSCSIPLPGYTKPIYVRRKSSGAAPSARRPRSRVAASATLMHMFAGGGMSTHFLPTSGKALLEDRFMPAAQQNDRVAVAQQRAELIVDVPAPIEARQPLPDDPRGEGVGLRGPAPPMFSNRVTNGTAGKTRLAIVGMNVLMNWKSYVQPRYIK